MGLDTSHDNIISSSPYSVNLINGKHIRIQWCKHAYFITHFTFKNKNNHSLELSILMYIHVRNNLTGLAISDKKIFYS